jgi:hypothetical protein
LHVNVVTPIGRWAIGQRSPTSISEARMKLSTRLGNSVAITIAACATLLGGSGERSSRTGVELKSAAAGLHAPGGDTGSVASERKRHSVLPGTGGWVVGATQYSTGPFFTSMETIFTVPPTPTSTNSNAIVFLWSGIESTNYVLQPVLQYNQDGVSHWRMKNYVVSTGQCSSQGGSCLEDTAQYVDVGDTIYTEVWLDGANMGANCSLTTGTNCNYVVSWEDATKNVRSDLRGWTQPEPLFWAQGMIFEARGISYTSCDDFPGSGYAIADADVWLTENSGSSLYAQDIMNLTADNPPTTNFVYPTFDDGSSAQSCGFFAAVFNGNHVTMEM